MGLETDSLPGRVTERVLITGGAGYLGSRITPHLLSLGYQVTVLDNLSFNQMTLSTCVDYPTFEFVRGDVTDRELLHKLLARHDIIIPLAGIVGAPACKSNPDRATAVNLRAIQMLVEDLQPFHKIVYPTTNSGYGIGSKTEYCDEDTPLNPISLYGQTKVEAERLLLETGQAVTLRLATVFGPSPRMRVDLLVNDFTYRAVTDRFLVLFEGHFRRNYIHIADVAKTFGFAIENFSKMRGKPFNVGLTSANLSKLELCELIHKYVPEFYVHQAAVGEDPDKRDYVVSNARIEALGWKPERSLEEGIRELVRFYKMVPLGALRNA